MPRGPRIKGLGESYYHIVSRIVEKQKHFTDEENLRNQLLLRDVEDFSGVQVLAYCFMSSHIHILLRVPKRERITREELLRRVGVLYGPVYRKEVEDRWLEFEKRGLTSHVEKEQKAFLKRMYDMGEFMKTLKQRITMSYNKRNSRKGTLWEERYKSILLEATPRVLSAVAAYIDLNPVRAGMVKEASLYRYSSYGEAVAGSTKARDGLCRIYQENGHVLEWDKVVAMYRTRLTLQSDLKKKAIRLTKRKLEELFENRSKISFAEILGSQIRFFSKGIGLGSEAFVELIRKRLKEGFYAQKRVVPPDSLRVK